jgi:hypothetical protein
VLRALTAAGTEWNPPVIFEDRDCATTSLAIVDGYPALAAGSHNQGGSLYFGRASDNTGDTWPNGIGELLGGGNGGYCDLELVNGRPAICYYSYEGQDLWYVAAGDAEGNNWSEPFMVAENGIVGEYCSMTVLGGNRPVIFYYDRTNTALMAAYWLP